MYASIQLKSTQKVNVYGPVVKYGKKYLSKESYKQLKQVMKTADESREKFIGVTRFVSDLSLTSALEYYRCVSKIVDSFPVSEGKPASILVHWNDIYRNDSTETHNFTYEMACVLFNIASLHTKKAEFESANMESLSAVQIVINEYKEAANCFRYIHTGLFHTYSHDNYTWDMSKSALEGFENYCHALSQYAVAKKADLSGTSPLAKSVIMYGCERMFKDAADYFGIDGRAALWNRYCLILAEICRARAYMYLYEHVASKLEESGSGAGLMEGMANEAKKLYEDVLTNHRRALPDKLYQEVTELMELASNKCSEALRKNRIYLESQASPDEFPVVEAKILHPLTEPDILDIGASIFDEFVPQYVKDAMVRYHQFVQQELEKHMAQIKVFNQRLLETKEQLHADDIINSVASRSGIPKELWKRIQKLQSEKGLEKLDADVETMRQLAQTLKQSLESFKEELQDVYSRVQPQAYHIVMKYYNEAKECTDFLETASKREDTLNKHLDKLNRNRSFLGESQAKLDARVGTVSASNDICVAMKGLKSVVERINAILHKREKKMYEVEQMSKLDGAVRHELMQYNGNADEGRVFSKGITPMKDLLHEIELDIQCQETYISELMKKVEQCNEVMQANRSVMGRQEFLVSLTDSLNGYDDATQYVSFETANYKQVKEKCESLKNEFDRIKPDLIYLSPRSESDSEKNTPAMKICEHCQTVNEVYQTNCITCGRCCHTCVCWKPLLLNVKCAYRMRSYWLPTFYTNLCSSIFSSSS